MQFRQNYTYNPVNKRLLTNSWSYTALYSPDSTYTSFLNNIYYYLYVIIKLIIIK